MTHSKKQEDSYQDLYVCMYNFSEKRKNILLGVKSSLMMQEDHQKIMEIRKNKSTISNEIKKSLEEINKLYADLRKNLPNVKNVLSYTEKEINELENQIHSLEVDNRENDKNIELEENMVDTLKNSDKGIKSLERKREKDRQKKEDNKGKHQGKGSAEKKEPEKIIPNHNNTKKKVSKLDRIQNNLKVIESKLKDI